MKTSEILNIIISKFKTEKIMVGGKTPEEFVRGYFEEELEELDEDEEHDYQPVEMVEKFCNPKQWKRFSKKRFDVNNSLYEPPRTLDDYYFFHVSNGYRNDYKCQSEMDAGNLPWVREFSPKHERLADTFLLRVVTSSDDSEIICWDLKED